MWPWGKSAGGRPAAGKKSLPQRSLQQAYEIRPRPVERPETEEQLAAHRAPAHLAAGFAEVRVPETLERPHRLTRRTQEHFKLIEKRIRDASKPRRYGAPQVVHAPHNEHGRYRCSGEEGLPVLVSMAGLDRALRLLDTWAKELERLGFVIALGRDKKLEARKDGEAFAFHLREGYTKHEFSPAEQKARKEAQQYPQDWEWDGSGKFTLAVEGSEWGASGEWTDRTVKLEAMLPEMLASIIEFVPLAKKVREERLEKERLQAEKERRRWAEESRRQDEQRRLNNLVKAEEEVGRSEATLRFLDRIEAEFRTSVGELPPAVAEWLAGVRDIARRSNPMTQWVSELRDLGKQNGAEPDSTTWHDDSE